MCKKSMKSLLTTLPLFLVGCSFIPEYHRPEAPVPSVWSGASTNAVSQGQRQAEEVEWQTFFPDARLQALITKALEQNRDLRIAIARVEESRAQYGIVRSNRVPNVAAVASSNRNLTPGDVNSYGKPLISERYDLNVTMTSFEIDFWGRVKSLDAVAKASYLATEEAGRAFRLSLIADVANTYLLLLELTDREQLTQATLQSRTATRHLIERRREVGLATDLDYLAAEGTLQTARAEMADITRQRIAAENGLWLLVGTHPADWPPGRRITEQGVVTDFAMGIPAEVLTHRPDVMAAEQRLIAANANIGAARAAFLPNIGLTASFGTASADLSRLFEAGSRAWLFQPVMNLPIFDMGRTAATVDLAEARKNIAIAEYEKIIQNAFREVADLLAARTQLAAQMAAHMANEKAQSERLQQVMARHTAQIANYLEVIDAQRDCYAAQQAVVQIRRQWLTAAVQLYKALGGGVK